MNISSRTPEGDLNLCPVCGQIAALEPCYPGGDSVCPSCGSLLWLIQRYVNKHTGTSDVLLRMESSLEDFALGSLDIVELVMELEVETGIIVSDEAAEELRSLRDLIEYLRRRQEE